MQCLNQVNKSAEIASPDALLIKKVAQINWEACFICQSEENNSSILSPFKSPQYDSDLRKSSYYKVAENLLKFYEYSDLLPTFLRIHLENYKTDQDLVSQLVKKKAVLHKTCMNKFKVITLNESYNFKRKVETKNINTSSSSPVETLCSTGIILSAPNYSDNCFVFLFF